MFKHTHTDDFVKGVRLLYIPVITDFDAATLTQSCLGDTFLRKLGLRLAKCDAICFDAIVLRGVDDQPTPATADVEQALSLLQAQFTANIIELTFLRCVKIVIGGCEVGAGVDHASVKPEGV